MTLIIVESYKIWVNGTGKFMHEPTSNEDLIFQGGDKEERDNYLN